jgi:heptaprenylglyceryl phosphate synthase
MQKTRRHLELLAPAKNADFGIEAINHGADAVYIGGPAFGARAKVPTQCRILPGWFNTHIAITLKFL